MFGIGLRIFFADRNKVLGLVFGVAFANLLIIQQGSLFVGVMLRTQSLIADAQEVNLWIMDPSVDHIDASKAIREIELLRVRSVPGVAWAVPFFRATMPVRTYEGRTLNVSLNGVDDATLIGMPRNFLLGGPDDLRKPNAIAADFLGFTKLWPGESPGVGKSLEMNDKRAVVTAIPAASAAFSSAAIIFTRYSHAVTYFPSQRNALSFILARSAPGYSPEQVAQAISDQTGLKASTSAAFSWETMRYYFEHTAIPLNFAIVIGLGVIVGVAIVSLTFNMFISDNIRQFAMLKALGATDWRIAGMVAAQIGAIGAIGYCIGLGGAAIFLVAVDYPTSELRGFFIPWWLAVASAFLTAFVMLIATAGSLRRVAVIDPAIAFRT